MKLRVEKPDEQPARSSESRGKWPSQLFGGRIRTSTAVLIIAFGAVWWVYGTYRDEPKPPPAPQVVPPGFIPDPAYTWVPRTRLQQPPVTITETVTPTPTTSQTPAPEEPPDGQPPTPSPVPGFPFCPPLCPPPSPAPPEEPGQGPAPAESTSMPAQPAPSASSGAPTPSAPPGPGVPPG